MENSREGIEGIGAAPSPWLHLVRYSPPPPGIASLGCVWIAATRKVGDVVAERGVEKQAVL